MASPNVTTAEVLKRFNYRQLFWKWHLYAGWFGGPLLMLIALTGAILVFGPEIDTSLRPDLWKIIPPSASAAGALVSDQSMIETLRKSFPEESVVFYRQNAFPDQPYQFVLLGKSRAGIHDVWINPYTGGVVGDRLRETSLVRIAEQLHRRLLAGEVGSSIIELMTGWGIVLTLTGIFLWWPNTWKTLRYGLTLSFRGSGYKVNWRLHNTLGAWTSVAVLAMCLTGMVFSTYSGALYHKLMDRLGASKNPISQPPPSTPVKDASPVSVDRLLSVVRQDLPAGTPLSVRMPRGPKASYVVTTLPEVRPEWRNRTALQAWVFDQYSGEKIASSNWHELHPLAKFVTISQAIHYGSIFGWPTKIIALVSCLILPVLSVSGYLIWWWKRQRRNHATSAGRAARELQPIQSRPISKWLVASLVVVGVIFPSIGVSFVALMLWELLCFMIGRFRRVPATEPARLEPAQVEEEIGV